jgi:hypothetical protein
MSKPILWLGPLEELDADFDPLLGRSAKQAQAQTVSLSPKVTLDPSRSVFDDPVLDDVVTTPVRQEPVQAEPVLPELVAPESLVPEPQVSEPQVLEPQAPEPQAQEQLVSDAALAEATLPDQIDQEPAPPEAPLVPAPAEAEVAPVSDLAEQEALEPVPAVAEPRPETDFTHNNDPIPTRQDLNADLSDAPAVLEAEQEAAAVKSSTPKKSFFASLFSLSPTPPEATAQSASINDIWAKSADNVQADTMSQSPEIETPLWPATGADTTSLRGRDLWAEMNTETSADDAPVDIVAEPEPANNEDALTHASDDLATDTQEAEIASEAETLPVIDDLTDVSDNEVVLQTSDVSENLQADDTDQVASDTQEAIDASVPGHIEPVPNLEADTPPELPMQGQVEPLEEVPPTPDNAAAHAFQNAFNADQFWALPKGTNPPHPEPDDTIDNAPREEAVLPEPIEQPIIEPEPQDMLAPATVTPFVARTPEPQPELKPLSQDAPSEVPPAQRPRQAPSGKRRKKKTKKPYIAAFFGTLIFGIALAMTALSSPAALGYPWDLISSYRWYWVIMAVVAAGIWGLSRGWKMVGASFAVMAANLFVTVPASGEAPSGGKTATAVIGWANVASNPEALANVFKDADKRKATLLMVAEAPQGVFTPPQGWTLIEAPVVGDPTAIAVLTKSTWRAATVPGEPTMARPPAGDLTVIGVHPQDAVKSRRRTPNRDALINRAGTRAGIQEGPTVVLGDFNAAPWDTAMRQFRNYGNVTRVRCGGWAGTTLTQAFGMIGVATDHAYVRDVKVTHCSLGSALTGGHHKPIWLYVAPQPAAPADEPKP